MSRLGPGEEFDLIRGILDRCSGLGGDSGALDASGSVAVGPGDDALVLAGDPPLVISTDMTVEGVHFRRDWISLAEAANRAVLAALSDLAGMAADPLGALISLSVAPEDRASVDQVAEGVANALSRVGAPLLGGDLTASPGPLILDVVVLGRAEEPMLRSQVRAGDELWVTGPLGGAGLALRAWTEEEEVPEEARAAFTSPTPRIREARWLTSKGGVRAGMDLSDGLAGDAAHLASASGVGVTLDSAAIPVFPGADLDLALRGGEDYELLVAARPGALDPLSRGFEASFGTRLVRVGRAEGPAGLVLLRDADGVTRPLTEGGFDHFRHSEDP